MARALNNGRLEMVSSGFSNSHGLVKGMVVNLEEVVASIRRAAEEAESKADITANCVVAGISGNHIKSHNFHGVVEVQGKNGEVTPEDMENAVRAASIPLSQERDIIHVLPQEFFLNGQGGIRNPVGLTGPQLDVNLHVVSCDSALSQSLVNAANKAQIKVKRIALQSIASGEAVLTPEEKELGTAVIDIGGGTTDIALYVKDSICFSSVIPVGGAHFTRDLIEGLRTSRDEAERIKIEFGSVLPEGIPPDETVSIQGLGARGTYNSSRKEMCEYLYYRGAELLELVKNDLTHSGVRERLVGGAVLTGGGSLMEGIVELAERILDMPVRQGIPLGYEGFSAELAHPTYACAVGLTLLEAQRASHQDFLNRSPARRSWTDRILSWFER
jgi:cell division protein FtsA